MTKFHLASKVLAVAFLATSGNVQQGEAFQSSLVSRAFGSSRVAMVATVEAPTASSTGVVAAEEPSTPPPLAPLTVWGDGIEDILETQAKFRQLKPAPFPASINCADLSIDSTDTASQLAYVKNHAMGIKQKMVDSGAVVFRGFDLMKTQEGFQQFYNALGMKPCLDPLHSVSARPTVDGKKNSAVYEAVNKESRKNFFIGESCLYNSSVWLSLSYCVVPDNNSLTFTLFARPPLVGQECTTNLLELGLLVRRHLSALSQPTLAVNSLWPMDVRYSVT